MKKMKNQDVKGCHHDIYFQDEKLWKLIVAEAEREQKHGISCSPSQVVREACIGYLNEDRPIPVFIPIRRVFDMTNVSVTKVGVTYRIHVENLQDGERVQTRVSFFGKDEEQKTVKISLASMISRVCQKLIPKLRIKK